MPRALALLAAALLFTSPALADEPPPGDGWTRIDLVYTPCAKDLPWRSFEGAPVDVTGAALPLPTRSGLGVTIAPDDLSVGVDVNGDGRIDEKVKTSGGIATVALTYPDGFTAPYSVRFTRQKKQWRFERAGYWKGQILGQALAVFDQNSNGTYDEYGKDGLAIGATTWATPMSRVIAVDGSLLEFSVGTSGRRAWFREFKGETGRLDVVTGFRTPGKLQVAVFRRGDVSLNVAGCSAVPTGSWELVGGEVAALAGPQKALIRRGRMGYVEVKAGADSVVRWGTEVRLTFKAALEKGSLVVSGFDVQLWGQGGEEYYACTPPMSPDIQVLNAGGKPVAQGNCPVCPKGSLLDWKSPVGAGPFRIQLVEKGYAKLFGPISSEVLEVK